MPRSVVMSMEHCDVPITLNGVHTSSREARVFFGSEDHHRPFFQPSGNGGSVRDPGSTHPSHTALIGS